MTWIRQSSVKFQLCLRSQLIYFGQKLNGSHWELKQPSPRDNGLIQMYEVLWKWVKREHHAYASPPPPPAFPVLECGSPPSVFSFSLALGINQTVSLHGNCSLHKSQLAHKKQSQQVRFTLHVDVQAMVSRKPHLPALYVAANCALPQEWKHTYTLKTGGENIHPSIAFYWLVLTTATTHDFSDIWSSPMINTI